MDPRANFVSIESACCPDSVLEERSVSLVEKIFKSHVNFTCEFLLYVTWIILPVWD